MLAVRGEIGRVTPGPTGAHTKVGWSSYIMPGSGAGRTEGGRTGTIGAKVGKVQLTGTGSLPRVFTDEVALLRVLWRADPDPVVVCPVAPLIILRSRGVAGDPREDRAIPVGGADFNRLLHSLSMCAFLV